MIRAYGRLAGLLVVGLGVALAFDATTSATGPDRTAASNALDSSRTQDAETSSDRGAVADWSLIAQNAIVVVGKKFPGEAAVHMGIVHATIYDVVVVIEGGYRPFAITPTVPPNTSLKTAVATASHRVLVGRFRDQQRNLDDVYYAYLNGISDEEAKANGIQVGEEVGVGMLLLRANDGLDSTVPYVQRRPGPGVYEPTAPLTPLGTGMPSVLPLALDNASQFRPNGPPALHSGEYAQDFKEVKDLGRFDSSERTEEQTAVAQFWTDHDIPQWNRNLLRLADAQGLTAIETARMLAMAHVAGADAMIGCFDAKYHYLSWRPIHAIQRAATDGNSHTAPDPTWQPFLTTANHPEYPSAHACHTTAIAEALESFFGRRHLRFSIDSLATDARDRLDLRGADQDGSKVRRRHEVPALRATVFTVTQAVPCEFASQFRNVGTATKPCSGPPAMRAY